jgi:quinohemoprotein ethanol dehydrogenase
MGDQFPAGSTQLSVSMSKCAIALLCCAFCIEPLFAQEFDWPYNGADVWNRRFQDIDQINPSNVSQLKLAWSFKGDSTDTPATEATPLVVDGVMYMSGNNGSVFALNPTTGEQIWRYTPSPAGFGTHKGVAYGQGLIFTTMSNFITPNGASLLALNAKTGALMWQTVIDSNKLVQATTAPQFIGANEGTVKEVIVSTSDADMGFRAHLDAYSPATGKLLWRFYTTEPSTWPSGATIQGGGVWQTATFDPTLNMVYFGVANPTPDFLAVNREGANLYTDSIVAVDATTGKLQWYFQMIHHDLWDLDCAQPIMLFSWNGIPAVEGTTKAGYTFILDRASGEPLLPYQEVPVPPTSAANAAYQHPWPTQPVSSIESLAQQQVNPWSVPAGAVPVPLFTTPSQETQVYQPGSVSGYEWFPAAYSPRTHMIYSQAIYHPQIFGLAPYTTVDPVALCAGNGSDCGADTNMFSGTVGVNSGVYGAINALTGKVAWSIPLLSETPASGMTVAGDLVFFADAGGIMYAASAATGEILWVFDALTVPGAGAADSTGATVYEMGGVEYVAMEFGGSALTEPVGGQAIFTGNALIAFALPSALTAAVAKAKAK